MPEGYKRVLDPLTTLAFAAAQTDRIALGTSVLNAPYYNPVVLARQLTALDVLSWGRLRVGLGLGWSKDEFDAVGVSMAKAAGRDPNRLQVVLRAFLHLTPRPVASDRASFSGSLEQVHADVEETRALGVDELFLDPTFSPDGRTAEGFLASMERAAALLR